MYETKFSLSAADERQFRRVGNLPGQVYGSIELDGQETFTVRLTAPYATATDWKKQGTIVTLSKRLWKIVP